MAPSTLGTFLRSFTFGHVRQLDRVLAESIRRAWAAGAGPGDGRLVIDIDSLRRRGPRLRQAGRRLRLHRRARLPPAAGDPLAAPARCCTSACARAGRHGARARFASCDELIARVRRAGAERRDPDPRRLGLLEQEGARATSPSGGCRYSIGVRLHKPSRAAIAQIPEHAWQPVADYPDTGDRELAETTLGRRAADRPPRPHARGADRAVRLLALLRLPHQPQRRPARWSSAEHRQHAEVELAIRDLKDQALAHFPSGRFAANAAWTVIAVPGPQPAALDRHARPARTRPPAPRARSAAGCSRSPAGSRARARRWTLHLPARWPWQRSFIEALTRIRALPAAA